MQTMLKSECGAVTPLAYRQCFLSCAAGPLLTHDPQLEVHPVKLYLAQLLRVEREPAY